MLNVSQLIAPVILPWLKQPLKEEATMSDNLHVNENIIYKTEEISKYFSKNRTSFNSFYQSEKDILKTINWFPEISVMDVGCGCGGLGQALNHEFGVENYIGIDINAQAIEMAEKINRDTKFSFLNSDIFSEINQHKKKSICTIRENLKLRCPEGLEYHFLCRFETFCNFSH